MAGKSQRDPHNLQGEDLLDDYVARARNRRGALGAATLRMRSVSMRDIFVHAALHFRSTSEELKDLLLAGHDIHDDVKDVRALAELGHVVLLQNLLENDSQYGQQLLTVAEELSENGRLAAGKRRVLMQQTLVDGSVLRAQELLAKYPDLRNDFYGYYPAEMLNPFTLGNDSTRGEWLTAFNEVFQRYGLEPVGLVNDEERSPFDRLTSRMVPGRLPDPAEHPLVSVVITAYRPATHELMTSVRSILEQTWQNLELIIVDDGSGHQYRPIFQQAEDLDRRITVIHLPENEGTYGARNTGFAAARGGFITGQDDDDWSHPKRIQRQLEYLQENPAAIGCRVNAVRCDENLGRVRIGYHPETTNASTLMIRRAGYECAGEFLNARKAADTEYYYRVAKASGRAIGHIDEPLSIIRILPTSLSRGDFSPGWRHTARRSFRSSYEHWHEAASISDLHVERDAVPKVKIPRRFLSQGDQRDGSELDVVFAGDWQQDGGPQKSMLEEIFALKRKNYRVGVMNLSAAWFMSKEVSNTLNEQVQSLINEGIVDEVHYDDEIDVRLLILRYPPILQFLPHGRSKIVAERLIILANQAPSEADGSSIRYLVPDCHRNAQQAFGVSPVWVPQGPQVRRYLVQSLTNTELATYDMPGILDIDDWWHEKLWYRSMTPVVGRHSRDHTMKWPSDPKVMEVLYPLDGRYDVRFMGGASVPMKVIGAKEQPHSWTIYGVNELPVSSFLNSLDYFIFYQHPIAVEAFGRAVLEAIASGTVTILPTHFQEVFGDAALYRDPEDVDALIGELHSNFGVYQAQLEQARKSVIEHFSYETYQTRISNILAKN